MLGAPIDKGFNRLAWLFPYLVGASGAVAIGFAAVRWSRQRRRRVRGGTRRPIRRSTSASTMSSETSTDARPAKPDAPTDRVARRPQRLGRPAPDHGFNPGSSSSWPRSAARPPSPSSRAGRASPRSSCSTRADGRRGARRPRGAARRCGRWSRPKTIAPRWSASARASRSSARRLLTLRTIKELEFDRAMGKLSDADFQEMSAGCARARRG